MFLLVLIALGLLIYVIAKNAGPSAESRLAGRNAEWVQFVAGYRKVVKNKAEKALIERILSDLRRQGHGIPPDSWDMWSPEEAESDLPAKPSSHARPAQAANVANHSIIADAEAPMIKLETKPKVELDNISLLLYFGAFLFITSVGLFIAFGGANGVVRTFAVLLVMVILYVGGIWLFHNRSKLQQAGLAFAGIGMTIAPLAGVAAYYYLFNQGNGAAVWLVTSILCMAMYTHALLSLRRPLINYLLIFTFLSLFESGVSVLTLPVYYFGWAMASAGIILTFLSRVKGFMPELQESSRDSAQLFLPLAVLTSLVLVPMHGFGQLGVSLLFAAAFYGLETSTTKDNLQRGNAIVTQLTAIAGLLCVSYAGGSSWEMTVYTLLGINILQIVAILFGSAKSDLWRNFATVLVISLVGGSLAALSISAVVLFMTMCAVTAGSLVVWLRQQRLGGYVVAVIGWMLLPVIYGQGMMSVPAGATLQTVLLLIALFVQLTVYVSYRRRYAGLTSWAMPAQQMYVLSLAGVVASAMLAPAWTCFGLVGIIVGTLLVLSELERDGNWAVAAGLVIAAPILRALHDPSALVVTNLTALLLNIFLALRYRKEAMRWFSTILWFVVPLSLGGGAFGVWPLAAYAWAYVAVMAGLIVSRAIARGSLFASSKVPLASFARSASLSYVVGYTLAGTVSLLLALGSSNSQLHATLIAVVLLCAVLILSTKVEKRRDLLAFVPFLAQFVLWSMVRPASGTDGMTLFLLGSTLLAGALYFANDGPEQGKPSYLRQGALITAFATPLTFMVTPATFMMPIGLLVAGALTYHRIRNTNQQNRELAGLLIVTAAEWMLWLAGVRELQAYVHVLIATFAGYAYWRAIRKETKQSDDYLLAMLATATVPLALQAIAGQAGGLYGWWLLLEQIAFMLLGMAISKSLVIRWGLYVAVGAVLYQLRHLGWAALTVLAIFLIGLAMYQLQKHDPKN